MGGRDLSTAVVAGEKQPFLSSRPSKSLAELSGALRPQTIARDEQLPVAREFTELLGTGGLRRGSVIVVEAAGASGATSVALGLLAKATAAGCWCAIVGLPDLGIVAATELGVVLDRLAFIPRLGPRPLAVIAALIDGCDIVLFAPPHLSLGDARRLAARTRERASVLIALDTATTGVLGGNWPEVPEIRLVVTGSFSGLQQGSGRITSHRVVVNALGRHAMPPTLAGELEFPASPDLFGVRRDLEREKRSWQKPEHFAIFDQKAVIR